VSSCRCEHERPFLRSLLFGGRLVCYRLIDRRKGPLPAEVVARIDAAVAGP
jgi:hypothetical protein